MKSPAQSRIFAFKILLCKINYRAWHRFFLPATFLILESCLAPDPRLYQIEKRREAAASDTLQQALPGAPAPATSSRSPSEEDPKTTALITSAAVPSRAFSEKPRSKQSNKPLRSNDPALKMVKEHGQTFGIYRLKEGEALYSAVVVRFTGRVEAAEVNQVARELMTLNGIHDETKIAIGTEIRIPFALIDEAFFLAPTPPPRPTPQRYFKHVILDAGHGGNDPGTIVQDLREDEIAFDLMRRLQAGLEKRGVKVHPLVSAYRNANERANGHALREVRRHQYVNVVPAYSMADSRIGLNLRIYLLEDIYNRLLREGVAPEEIVFISIHLDHLHPAVGGTMVYIPSAEQRLPSFRVTGDVYNKYTQSRGQTISFDAQQCQFAESCSEEFAQNLIGSLRRARLPVHAYNPIRQHVYRGGSKWTPGIIRYSRVPVSVLIEAANLAHRADWQRIRSSDFRQRWAEAVVRPIVSMR